ncbi:MAG: universal stress protein [SAR202 cluster bacterium]|nr:universal stress protein [SAR202 cluster bacterium]
MFTKVLVPLDGTEVSANILPYVSRLAKGLNMPVVLLTVINPETLEQLPQMGARAPMAETLAGIGRQPSRTGGTVTARTGVEGPYASQVFERAEFEVKRALGDAASKLKADGVAAEVAVTLGNAAGQIMGMTARHKCDLVAMSTHGRNALARGMLGSVTDKVIRSSPVPVLAIAPERAAKYADKGQPMTRVMAPLDGSPFAETALSYVKLLAKRLGMGVTLVRVMDIGGLYTGFWDDARFYEIGIQLRKEAEEYLKGQSQKLTAEGLKVQWKVLSGNPGFSLVDLARTEPQDLVVLTTHARVGLSRLILGSVTEALVRSSGDPVLVVPSKEEEK